MYIVDTLQDPEFTWFEAQAKGGHRTVLGVPLLRENTVIGVIVLGRNVVRPFTDEEIKLVTTFADQAVIAIENVRLFDEVQARSRDLTEALEQQTATSAILRVISTSTTEVQPVFETIVRNAVALCGSLFANVFRFDGELLHFVASHNVGPSYVELLRAKYPMRPNSSQVSGRVVLTRSMVRLEDALADPDYDQQFPAAMGWHRMLGVPMLRQGEPVGVIVVSWAEAGPVPKAQEELLKQFADQAVIAIENARLFDEVQARTRDLTRSVAELRALGEVSREISSTLALQTVLRAIAAHAVALAEADAGVFSAYDEAARVFRLQATHGLDPEVVDAITRRPVRLGEGAMGQAGLRRAAVQIADIDQEAGYAFYDTIRRPGYRALLGVPLLREDSLVGALVICRKSPGAFSAEAVDLVQTLANQSVLAIQNARLFEELEQKGQELAAASRHKSEFLANMSHELRTPLNAIIGIAEMLREDAEEEGQEALVEPLQRIHRAGDHLLHLINEILDLSKIEAGKLELHVEDVGLAAAIQDVAQTAEPLAARNGNQLTIDCPEAVGSLRADSTRLRQIVLNLLSNACKFTERGEVQLGGPRRPGLGHDQRRRHRHRHDARAGQEAVPGVQPGRRLDHAPLRRHRPGPCHQPPARAPDGGRHHGRERSGRRHDLHGPAAGGSGGAGRGPSAGRARPAAVDRSRTLEARRRRCRDRAGGRRRGDGARPDAPVPRPRRLRCGHGQRWRGGARARAAAAPGADHARCPDAGPGWLERAAGAQGRSRARRDSGRDADHHRRAEPRLYARRRRLSDQADPARPAAGAAGPLLPRCRAQAGADRRRRSGGAALARPRAHRRGLAGERGSGWARRAGAAFASAGPT